MSLPGEVNSREKEPAQSDRLLGGRVFLRQPVTGYRTAIDPVLLAAAVPALAGQSVLDLGCGSGAAALCLLARCRETRVVGLELQPDMAALAAANARESGLDERFAAVCADLLHSPFRKRKGVFEHVMANPPYLPPTRGRPSKEPKRTIANVEGAAKLADWVTTALALVERRGSVTFIHRADRLDELLALLSGRTGGIVVAPLWPVPGRPAKRVIVRARPGVGAPLRLSPGLTLHHLEGGYTEEAERVLREAKPFDL